MKEFKEWYSLVDKIHNVLMENGGNEPLDGDEVDIITDAFKNRMNYLNGNTGKEDKPSFNNKANEEVHFEFEAGCGDNPQEVEIYIGGYFLASVDIKDISPEAKEILFN
jgi:hypothetical protein